MLDFIDITARILGYVVLAGLIFALLDELVEWLTRGDSARPIPKQKKPRS